jgi:hypothetical protein
MMMIMEESVECELAGETELFGEICPTATLSNINPTWPDPGSNPGRRGGKPATNRLSRGKAVYFFGYSFKVKNFELGTITNLPVSQGSPLPGCPEPGIGDNAYRMRSGQFIYLVPTSQKTPMCVAITSNTTVCTRQRNNNSYCLLVIKQWQNHRKLQALRGLRVPPRCFFANVNPDFGGGIQSNYVRFVWSSCQGDYVVYSLLGCNAV